MLVSSDAALITIVEFVAVRDLQATEVEALSKHLHQLSACGKPFFFRLPDLAGFDAGSYLDDGFAAPHEDEALACLSLGDTGFGVLLELLDGDATHECVLSCDCTLGGVC